MPLANCVLIACRTASPSSAASVASCSLPSTTSTSSKPAATDLPDGPPDERLAAERQEELLRPHPRRRAGREHHCADHENSTSADRLTPRKNLPRLYVDIGHSGSCRARQEVGDVIPAAFDYLRAHTTDEAFAHLQQHGAEARVLAGGQSLIPAMRFRLARPGRPGRHQLADRSELPAHRAIRCWPSARSRETATSSARRGSASADGASSTTRRAWSPIRSCGRWARSSAACATTIPSGDWTTVALASRATVVIRGKDGTRRVPIDDFLVDSFATAVGEGEMALGAEFPVPDDRTAGSYQKVERKVGDFATAAAAVQVSLNADGTIRAAGVALSAAGAVRRARRRGRAVCWRDRSRPRTLIRAAADAASAAQRAAGRPARQRRIQEASGWRARGARSASGVLAAGGAGMKVTCHGQRRQLRAGRRAAHAARVSFLREECRLTGTHVGCDTSSCGCCVVVMDGTRAVKSCTMFAAQADGHEILTVEGLARRRQAARAAAGLLGSARPAVRLLHARHAAHVVRAAEAPAEPERGRYSRGLAGNLCRCTGYQNIVKAVQQAAGDAAPAGRRQP